MSSDATADGRFRVLIVEDNPDLRRQLCHFLAEHGLDCFAVQNEDEAADAASYEFGAIVADIDLSEAGGHEHGGVLLAERLVAEGPRIPIVLISYNAQLSLPPKDSPEYSRTVISLGLRAVLDRNSETFREELVSSLLRAGQT